MYQPLGSSMNFKEVLKALIIYLTGVYEKLSSDVKTSLAYNPLSPTDEAGKSDKYIEAIEWALDQSNKIKNIAITGPYGSGKSSIIQTFQKKYHLNNKYRFLNISLATFKEDKVGVTGSGQTKPNEGQDILRLIELSILQQIFYHETDSTIPDSRFIKIEKKKKWIIALSSLGLLLGVISFLYLVYPDFLSKFALIEIEGVEIKIAQVLSVLITGIVLYFVLFKLLFFIKSIVIKKVTVSNAEIELDQGISKSILNKHLDEILYFFEMTKYNVVIIEDLDRFEQNEVFTKLRELNLLLNNSRKIKRNIVFIYAIKDDMFKDRDRAKFFDFIIPVIPIINASNSNEILIHLRKENKYKISDAIIDDLSLFVDDMRLLYNIMNEFHIYSLKIDKNLSRDKLLGMMVYKNMHPNDFAELGKNQGVLYELLSKRNSYLKEARDQLQDKILELKNEIKEIDNIRLNSVKDLRRVYIFAIIQKIIIEMGTPFYNFIIGGSAKWADDLLEDDNFNLIKSNLRNQAYQMQNGRRYNINFDFEDLDEKNNWSVSYDKKESLLLKKSSGEINKKKQEIQELEKEKIELGKKKLKDFVSQKKIDLRVDGLNVRKQERLLDVLLRQGYIDEDYLDYISIFHEGSLSRKDYDFLLNVKTQSSLEYSYSLDNYENVLKKINSFEFEKPYLLNFELVEFLILSELFPEHKKSLTKQLIDESDKSFNFIDELLDVSEKADEIIRYLANNWDNIWNYICSNSEITDERREEYFKSIISNANIDAIEVIFEEHKRAFSDYIDFVDYLDISKVMSILSRLNLKLDTIPEKIPQELNDYIYKNNNYSINVKNLKWFIVESTDSTVSLDEFNTKNYTVIMESELDSLKEYVQDNIEFYLREVFLAIDLNTDDEKDLVLSLVNNEDVTHDLKYRVFKKSKYKFNINEISDVDIMNDALSSLKIEATWGNVCDAFIKLDEVVNGSLIEFLNFEDNVSILKRVKISKEYPDEDTAKRFIRSILIDDRIEDTCYSNILNSIPYFYYSLGYENLSENKVTALAEKRTLAVNSENYAKLKSFKPKIALKLIEFNEQSFLEKIDELALEEDDEISILRSKKISLRVKEKVVSNYSLEKVSSANNIIKAISELILTEEKTLIDNKVLVETICRNTFNATDKIKMFIKCQSSFTKDDISRFLNVLPDPYPLISVNGKKPTIEKTEINKSFVEALKNQEYISSHGITIRGKIRVNTFKG